MNMHLKLSSRSSPKWRHKYDQDPATVCSAVHYRLQNISPRLASSLAVNAIISAIRKRPVVHRLYLGASSIGDAGCVRLFEFLASSAGLRCREGLTELFLTNNEIGARGLLAVAAFLRGNTILRELCLSGNPLTTDPEVIIEFASALNSSRLCTLQILHSNSLGDSFTKLFFSQLASPYLRELDLSAINMTQASVPILADYVRSTRCRLERLQCNANSLTLSGACKIVNAIGENYSLRNVRLDDLHIDDHAAAVAAAEDRTVGWQRCNGALFAVLQRNSAHVARVKTESLALLRYSRALFLRSVTSGTKSDSCALSSSSRSKSLDAASPFFDLPTELQQEIFSYLAPSLSHQQRMQIIYFAADAATLFHPDHPSNEVHGRTKQLDVRVKSGLGRRSSLQHQGQPFEGSWRPPMWWECYCSTDVRPSCRCLRRWKREMRDIWLTQMACNAYGHVL